MARRIGSVASSPWTCFARGFLAVPQSDLVVGIREWIGTWNYNPRPWTKTADQILESIARYCTRINDSRH